MHTLYRSGPARPGSATAIALQAQPGSVDTVAVARRHITDAITEAALARADAEVAP